MTKSVLTFLTALLVFSLSAVAQVKQSKPTTLKEPPVESTQVPSADESDPVTATDLDQPETLRLKRWSRLDSRDLRKENKWTAQVQLSTASFLIPFRPGLSMAWNHNPEWSFEVGYMAGSFSAGVAGQDVASLSEKSYQFRARYFGSASSFNYILGLSQEVGHFRLGNRYLNFVTGAGDISLAKFSSYAVNIGLGNRWHWENGLTLGIDWATLVLPISVGDTNSDYFQTNAPAADKESLRDSLDVLAKFPRFAFFTLSAGWSF